MSVGPSVGPSVSIKEKRGLGASYVRYPTLFASRHSILHSEIHQLKIRMENLGAPKSKRYLNHPCQEKSILLHLSALSRNHQDNPNASGIDKHLIVSHSVLATFVLLGAAGGHPGQFSVQSLSLSFSRSVTVSSSLRLHAFSLFPLFPHSLIPLSPDEV